MRLFARIRLPFLIALVLSAAVSVAAQSAGTAPVATTGTAVESPCMNPANEPQDDWTLMWRLRAYRDLDCIISMMDQRLANGGSAALTRDQLQEIRMRALSAKDAAARIGR
jgi:hypothetical protein